MAVSEMFTIRNIYKSGIKTEFATIFGILLTWVEYLIKDS